MSDIYNLDRFIQEHNEYYPIALQEIKNGRKKSHWMWFIFPQLKGLGKSDTSNYYGISGLDEAKAYLNHEILGKNLIEISNVLLELNTNNAIFIFGYIDNIKLKSCMTLFSLISAKDSVFNKVLDKFFKGSKDIETLKILNIE